PGLDARSFLDPKVIPRPPLIREWLFSISKLLFGAGLFCGAVELITPESGPLVPWLGMVGLIFMLHFGLFHLLSCLWRSCGAEAKPLMDWPIASRSVGEFWGRRWNTAFRYLTHRFLFRPLAVRLGPRRALFAGFLFSGVVHDLVISLPAGG